MFVLGRTGFALFLHPGRTEGPGVFCRWKKKLSSGGRDVSAAAAEMAMGDDEFRREPVTLEVTCSCGMVDADCQIFVNFKMEVGRVHPMVRSDGSHLLPALELLALAYRNSIQMRV